MNLVFLLEEPLAREMLKGLLPRLVHHSVQIRYVVFEGKQDLEKNIVRRLRGWRAPDSVFVVLRDQDAANCLTVRRKLAQKCHEAGKPETIIRIACRELESWYFGDLAAVGDALALPNLTRYAKLKKYRIPDAIHAPGNELRKISRNTYQKVAGSRAIGPGLSPDNNLSHSFGVFVAGIRRAVANAE